MRGACCQVAAREMRRRNCRLTQGELGTKCDPRRGPRSDPRPKSWSCTIASAWIWATVCGGLARAAARSGFGAPHSSPRLLLTTWRGTNIPSGPRFIWCVRFFMARLTKFETGQELHARNSVTYGIPHEDRLVVVDISAEFDQKVQACAFMISIRSRRAAEGTATHDGTIWSR